MEISEILSTIKDRVAKGKLEEAIGFGLEYLKTKDFLILASRYNRVEKANMKGVVTFEQYQVELNKITESLLETLQNYPREKRKKKNRRWFVLWIALNGLFFDWKRVALMTGSLTAILVGSVMYLTNVQNEEWMFSFECEDLSFKKNWINKKQTYISSLIYIQDTIKEKVIWYTTFKRHRLVEDSSGMTLSFSNKNGCSSLWGEVASEMLDGQDFSPGFYISSKDLPHEDKKLDFSKMIYLDVRNLDIQDSSFMRLCTPTFLNSSKFIVSDCTTLNKVRTMLTGIKK